MEIWKPIPGSTYEASSLGRIRSPRGNVLKPYDHPLGYHLVTVPVNGPAISRTVHSLVAAAFHGPRPDGVDVAHGNCVKTDNRPSNLRYCSRAENLRDSVAMGILFGGRPPIYPWDMLAVGDGFQTRPLLRASILAMCANARRRYGYSYKVPKAANDDGSWTVTRVA